MDMDDEIIDASLDCEKRHLSIVDGEGNEEKCPICLDSIENLCLLDPCYHSFCFVCIYQWYQFTPKCPLCKREVDSFLYDIKTDREFKTLSVRAPEKKPRIDRWGVPSQEAPGELDTIFPFTPAHERRKRVYQREIIPVPITGRSQASHINTFTEDSWDRKIKPWIQRELQSILEERNVDTLLLMFHQIFQNHSKDLFSKELFSEVEEFLQHFTSIFMRELHCFLASSLNMQTYDNRVLYQEIDFKHPQNNFFPQGEEKTSNEVQQGSSSS